MIDKVYEIKKALKEFTMVGIHEDMILFDDLTVYNEITGEEEQFKSVEEIVERYPDMIIEVFEVKEGGRGQKSKGKKGKNKNGGSGSDSIVIGERRGRKGKSTPLATASFNNQGRFVDTQKTLKEFQKRHQHSDKEHGLAINEQGFVTSYSRGNSGSVAISSKGAGKNHTTIHNHPNNSLFSNTDMKSFTASRNEKSMYITTNTKTPRMYGVTKGKNFNGKGFVKGYEKAVKGSHTLNTYNKRARKFLRDNQEKFGYTYTQS